MFVHMVLVHMVEMTIVKIVHMAVMANSGVSAFRAMSTRVLAEQGVVTGVGPNWIVLKTQYQQNPLDSVFCFQAP